ncbi:MULTISPECIES: attachment invasion locus protein Ail [Yersinia]|uniref:Attachment and invasion locus n=3 Tax=Yersinia enterocolitica TaxID=630 RepID=G4U4B5_YEREN|nr:MULTISPECIES: attachment invasion locus protein Ail [Yersinia]EKN4774180.1 attachment invasion locus protein Ail [Yersinia enterocolitica]MBW5814403.1 attachment invasion locus protein Ail [Yersinia kristensenii]MBW5818903.1 attachment invasion locus protein Ail [Yersinia kristensenii]MBW5826235.1 attachment invasion locus protein Ail [Yersinia kristensenii]MBW5831820.1 attachment invasion locus protein Ail [Yersinia kristensenii]
MKKTLLASSLIACLSIASVNVYAASESSISIGYAQSHVKENGYTLDNDPKGFNLKYRYELDDNWGVIGSFAYTHQGYDFFYGSNKFGHGDVDYYSVTMGPSFRINEYVSLYGLLGAAHGKVKSSVFDESISASKTSMAYGAGVQFNPLPNFVIDASYEYSKLDSIKVGTWMLGAGYRF